MEKGNLQSVLIKKLLITTSVFPIECELFFNNKSNNDMANTKVLVHYVQCIGEGEIGAAHLGSRPVATGWPSRRDCRRPLIEMVALH